MEKIKSVALEKYEFENRDESQVKALLEVSDYQDSDARDKIQFFPVNSPREVRSF